MSEVVRRLTEDVANIQKLGDNPRTDNGMDAAELKAWFDKAPEAIKSFLNESMIPDIERKFRSQDEWADTVDEAINSFVKGEGFVPLDGSQPMTGDLNMDGHRVVGVADPTDGSHATNKKYVDSVKETANTALAKANAAQPALNFVPVQQGFADGTGGSKIRLGWKQASNGYWTIGVEVANLYIGDVVVDSSEFGSTTPVWRGGTGAMVPEKARENLLITSHTTFFSADENGKFTLNAPTSYPTKPGVYRITTPELPGLPVDSGGYGSLVIFNCGSYVLHFHVDYTGAFYYATTSAVNNTTVTAPTESDWRRVLANILSEEDYGEEFPANAVTGRVYYVKG